MIYRPVELEHFGCYDMISKYEMKRMTKEKIESNNILVESKKTFNLLEEHPSHRCMVMSERSHYIVPCINSLNLLPDIADLHPLEETNDPNVISLREKYAAIVLLLFYPYRIQDDLEIDGSYWKNYRYVIDNNILSSKSLEVCQNIQDVSHNCSKLKQAEDELKLTTVFTPHKEDNNKNMSNNEENTISVEDMADMLEQLEDHGVREVDPKQRSLNIIGQRHNIVPQDIPATNTSIPDITDIPKGITVNSTPNTKQNECNDKANSLNI